MTFKKALQSGYLGRVEDRAYMDWVKTLPCCGCGVPADDPHHITGIGKGMGSKVPDYFVIPVCRKCHDEIHHDASTWEFHCGAQAEHVMYTLLQAITEKQIG